MSADLSLTTITTQTNGSLLAIGAVWTFTVNVAGAQITSSVLVTPQDLSFLSSAPVASVLSAGVVTVKVTASVALASGATKSFIIRVFI